MVGIVIVSHSRRIAQGVVDLAREMGGEDVVLVAAGGADEEDALGTDAMRVLGALDEAYSDDGVLVLMDLGSAVMSAEMAVEMIEESRRARVLLCEAPLVEGAVAAATAAKLGRTLEEVAHEARGGLAGKQTHLSVAPEALHESAGEPAGEESGPPIEATIVIQNPLGLHARPAARFVRAAGEHGARVEVMNLTTGRGPVDATSLNALTTLGVVQDHAIRVQAWGPDAESAIKAIEALAADNFGDPVEEAVAGPPSSAVSDAELPEGGIAGLPASPGVALGPARRFARPAPEVPTTPAADIESEIVRLETAVAAASVEIGRIRDEVSSSAGSYEAEIFDAHVLMLEDVTLQGRAQELIREQKRNAADALWASVQESASQFESVGNARLRERARDVVDVGQRVLGHLLGQAERKLELSAPGVLIVEELTPSTAAGLDPDKVRGIATATGGPTSHGAILARALGVPAVVGGGERLLDVPEDTAVIVDGDRGIIIVDPVVEVSEQYADTAQQQAEAAKAATAAAGEPAVTRDGTIIEVAANVGSVEEVAQAAGGGADGVGLLRTEFLFLERSAMPTEDEQFDTLSAIARALGDRPLTIRTLDVGADKPLPYLRRGPEENPFLGVRGIRLGLAQRDLLTTQIKAIARLASERPVRVMFPMVASVEELTEARGLLDEIVGHERPTGLEVGIMVEVPSAALMAARFAPDLDFFSIGTNDLSQYTLAAERGNADVASLADPLHPSVLKLISSTVEAAAADDAWVGVCGELAGDARATGLLLGLGVTELSMAAPSIASVKAAVRTTSRGQAAELATRALEASSASDVRRLLTGEPAA
ncbi:MAG: phosphoenolpyruvate--protein phosphotransferase [Actinobacteria bacterium]|nr:phosphoenolpyruvate--protein phosphotransferase [Actinomycetota bacterium]